MRSAQITGRSAAVRRAAAASSASRRPSRSHLPAVNGRSRPGRWTTPPIEWLLDFGAPRQLLQLYGEAPLRPVCGARFLRRSVMLRLADGSRAELACDCGVLHGKTEELPFAEVELESKEGAPDAAKALAGRLAKQYNLRWEPLSKFARANALK